MLEILTNKICQQEVQNIVDSIDRLNELVSVITDKNELNNQALLCVENKIIQKAIDWFDNEPPYIIPPVEYTEKNLLALIFYSLGNHQKSLELLSEDCTLHSHILITASMELAYELDKEQIEFASKIAHNKCIIAEYMSHFDKLNQYYKKGILLAENDEIKALTIKYYVGFLLDTGKTSEAEEIICSVINSTLISNDAKNVLETLLAKVKQEKLTLPFAENELLEIEKLLAKGIAYLEAKGLKMKAGLLLMSASEIASFQKKYVQAKDYINKAIIYFKGEGIDEFLGEAGLQKAIIFYMWSKNGQPQYYKSAINAYQDTLKIFKRDTHPEKFAYVHHHMALIYSEIPVSTEEKAMWTAFCASSFKEALEFYTKENYPYEYAMVCHNYATALINFPEAKLHNNYMKAYNLFEEALKVRSAEEFTFERTSTLINQLELFWLMPNKDDEEEIERIAQMQAKIEELEKVADEKTLKKVVFHKEKLESLKYKL